MNGRDAASCVFSGRAGDSRRSASAVLAQQGASGEAPLTPVCVGGVFATTAEWVSRVGELHTHAGIQCFPAE